MNNTKKRILTTTALILLTAIMAIGVVFAVITQSLVRKYQTTITVTNVVFRFNEKTYYEEIGSADIDIYKGEAKDITLSLEVLGSGKHIVSYSVGFEFTENSEITEVIEVYHFDGNHYVYLCMLDQLESLDSQILSGVMSTDFDKEIYLRLVYPATVSDYYAGLSDKNFVIKASADAAIVTATNEYVFAADYAEFKALFENNNTVGKTIILLNDVLVEDALTSKGIVGVDTNGFELKLGANITVNCGNDTDYRLGITNSGMGGGISSLSSNYVSVINAKTAYLVDNEFLSGQASGMVRISGDKNDFTAIYADFISFLNTRKEKLTNGSLYYYGSDVSFLFYDVSFYLGMFNMNIPTDSVIQKNAPGDDYIIISADYFTDNYLFAFLFSYDSAVVSMTGYVTVRGNSPQAIADALVGSLPDLIQSSQYFRTYDSYTGSYIDWQINDGLSGDLLDSNGRYKRKGMDAVAERLDDFKNRKVDLYLKVTKGAETGSKEGTVGDSGDYGETYLYYPLMVEVANAADLTALIFDSTPAVIYTGESYDIYNDALISTHLDKANLSGIKVEIVPGSDRMGYLEIAKSEAGETFDLVKIREEATIGQNTLHNVELIITFIYGSGESQKTHTIEKGLTISGDVAEITKYDMSYRLQSAFIGNDYTEGRSFEFYAYGALMPQTKGINVAVMIDYTPIGEAAKFISVTYEYVEIAYDKLEDQVAYFVMEDGEFVISDTEDTAALYYERKAVIEIIPGNLTITDQIMVYLTATLYTLDENGNPHLNDKGERVYIDPVTDRKIALSYTVSLIIDGVIRNTESQVPDSELYNVYLQLFDTSGDGVITAREADDWETAVERGIQKQLMKSYTSEESGVIYFIDLNGKRITSLKGVEYFPKTQGFDLTGTGRKDISILSQLHHLVYLDLKTNSVSDLAPLAYLDRLEYLNLNDNAVSNLEPLRYLPRLVHLYVNNNSILNFEPLTEIMTMRTLSITGMRNANNVPFTGDEATMYDFAIIKINNLGINFIYSPTITITTEMMVAAKVMRDLEEINRVRHVLYLPTFYYYLDENGNVTRYRLLWYTAANEENLTIYYEGYDDIADIDYDDDVVLSYKIKNPYVDQPVTLSVKVYTNNANETYFFCRQFNITLETLIADDGLYIYNTANGEYVNAATVIPDSNLRRLVFEYFNAKDNDELVNIGGGVSIEEYFVISADDFTYINANKLTIYNWSNQGIADLTGIEYLNSIFTSNITLNLTGNPLDVKYDDDGEIISGKLSPLAKLTNLGTLTVGGDEYEFSELVGMSSLIRLNAYECYYDIEYEEESLKGLYALYVSKTNLNIYLESATTIWNPYLRIMPKKIQSLATTATFQKLGDTYDLYHGGNSIPLTIYGKTYYFLVNAAKIYAKNTSYDTSNTTTNYVKITTGTSVTAESGKVSYNSMFGAAESAYAKITLRSSATDGRAYISHDGYYFHMIFDDPGKVIKVHGLPGDDYIDENGVFFGDLVASYDLRAAALTRVYTYMLTGTTSTSRKATSLSQLLSAGFEYYYYFDAATGIYHITTEMFSRLGAMNATVGSFTYNVNGSTLNNYGTYDTGKSSLGGLRYFTNITTLTCHQDANLGDGSELVNLTRLNLYYSSVNLTTITQTLPNLTSLYVQNFYTFEVGTGADAAFRYMPNLSLLSVSSVQTTVTHTTSISMYMIDDFSFLRSFIHNEKTNLKTLTLYGVGLSTVTSSKNAGYARELYEAALNNSVAPEYKVGSPQNAAANGFFRIIDDQMWFCTNNTDATKSLSWEEAGTDSSLVVTEASDYGYLISYMRDMGLKVNDRFWWDLNSTSRSFELNVGDELTLPYDIGTNYFGLLYGENNANGMERTYDIQWSVYWIAASADGVTTKHIYSRSVDPGNNEKKIGFNDNGYLVVIGTLTGVPSTEKIYSFLYHFVVGDGDGYYSEVEDVTLRAFLFTAGHEKTSTVTSISIAPTSSSSYRVSNSAILSNMGLTALSNDSQTNYIYNLKGFDKAVEQWGISDSNQGIDKITSITIQAQRMMDISPLYAFENLTTLNLSGVSSNYLSYARFRDNVGGTSIEGKLMKLTELNLSYCIAITPDDVVQLIDPTGERKLTKVSLYGTNAMYNRETIVYLNDMLKYSGVTSLSLSLSSASASLIAATAFKSFVADTDPSNASCYPNGVTDNQAVFSNGTETKTIDSNTYTFTMTSAVHSMLLNNSVANEVPIKLMISAATIKGVSITQFRYTYIETVYKTSGISSPMRFGSDNETIDKFDTELIAYLFTSGYMVTNEAGSYIISKTNRALSLNYTYGIILRENANERAEKLKNGTYVLTYTTGINNTWAMSYKTVANDFELSSTPTWVAITQIGASTSANYSAWNTLLHNAVVANTYKYSVNTAEGLVNQSTYTATLPSHVYYMGSLYNVNWSIVSPSNLVNPNDGTVMTTANSTILSYDANEGVRYELSRDTIAVADDKTTGTFYLKFTITHSVTGAVLHSHSTASTGRSVTVTKYEDSSVAQLGYSFYVQTSILNGKAVLDNGSGVYYSLDVAPRQLSLYNGKYYENSVGTDRVYVVPAYEIFSSGRLIQYLFAKYFSSNIVYDTNASYGLQSGYLMTTAQILALEILELQHSTSTSTNNYSSSQYITSIEGVQIFCNMDVFLARSGAFTSIEPLSTLSLTSFTYGTYGHPSYYNSSYFMNYGTHYVVNDFTPLLEGSKDTLAYFSYNDLASPQMTDMNFLLSFTNPALQIYIGVNSYSSSYTLGSGYKYGLAYFATFSGKYLVYALGLKDIYIYVNSTSATNAGAEYDSTKGKTITGWASSLTVYPLSISVEYRLAFDMLNDYSTISEDFNNKFDNTYAELLDNYLINIHDGGFKVDKDSNSINFELNSLIFTNGGYFFVDWITAKGDTTVNGYYLEKNLTINVDGVLETFTAGTLIPKKKAKIIAESIEYYSAYKSSENCLRVSVTVKVPDPDDITDVFSRLICRLENTLGYFYERTLDVVFDNVSYL